MRILITGYNGFIGRHLTKKLLEDGHDVYGIDNFSNSKNDFSLIDNDRLYDNFCQFDIEWDEYDWLSRHLGNIDVIFHLAAKARVRPSFVNPVEWHNTNVTGTLKLLEFARVNNIKKFIYSSSSSVYGISTPRGSREHAERLYPMSPYALQKIQAEELCEFYHETFGMQTISLRYFNVYGENQPSTGNYPQLIPILLKMYRSGLPFTIYGDGYQRRDYTYVGDVVDANVKAMESSISGVFNIGTGTNYSVNQICDTIDPTHPREYLPAVKEPRMTLANIDLATAKLNWKPSVSLESWLSNQKFIETCE